MPTTELTERLLACRDAEDYFAVLEVPFDPHVLRVNRLHILRLFGPSLRTYLAGERSDGEGLGAGSAAIGRLRQALSDAHGAFASSTALDHRLFKVLRDRAPGPSRTFVPLDGLAVEESVRGSRELLDATSVEVAR